MNTSQLLLGSLKKIKKQFNKDKHLIFDPFYFTELSESSDLNQFIEKRVDAIIIKRSNYFHQPHIHIPIRVNSNHWILITVNKDNAKLTIFDSLNEDYKTYSHLIIKLKNFFTVSGLDIKHVHFDNSLEQNDGYNCGIAVLTRLAASTLLDVPYNFRDCHSDFLPDMRKKKGKKGFDY